jgi:hypothetical protein
MTEGKYTAAILAEPMLSTRVLAAKVGCSTRTVVKTRQQWRKEHGEEGRVSTEANIQSRVISWTERAELLAADVEKMLQKAANDPKSRKDPKLIHAICGGVKIVFDALGDWRMTNAGRNAPKDSEAGAVPTSDEPSNVTPIRAAG